MRPKRLSKERFGERLLASLDAGGGKVHRFLKGGQLADSMYSALFGRITNNPSEVLRGKFDFRSNHLEMFRLQSQEQGMHGHS